MDSLEIVTAPARGLYADNSLENVITNLLTKIANDDVQEEFKQLKSLKPTDNSEVAKHRENKTKNRFRNVLPCEYIDDYFIFILKTIVYPGLLHTHVY